MPNQPSWPFEDDEHLAETFYEQGERIELAPLLQRLAEWQAPVPSPAETQRLFLRLQHVLPRPAPVRQALAAQWAKPRHASLAMLAIVRAQVSILQASFWVASLAITLVGALVVFGLSASAQDIFLRACGPLLAYLSTVSAFRAADVQVLEFELVCPLSLLQLTIARLVVILGYDVVLGLFLSLLIWTHGSTGVWLLTFSWLMPLLLVVGLTLFLSQLMRVRTAASLAYSSWLAVLVPSVLTRLVGHPAPLLSPGGVGLTGLTGLVLFVITGFWITKTKGEKASVWNW